MDFTYANARFPDDRKLIAHLNLAAAQAYEAIRKIDTNDLEISDYNKRYFGKHQRTLQSSLQKYGYLLAWAFANFPKPLAECTVVDYGGGSGVLSLLARAAGIGTVIYNDIYDVSCHDAQLMGREVGLEADHYVQGDVDDLTQYLHAQGIVADAIISYDVIEHIYDIEQFFGTIANWPGAPFRIVMASGANPHNPMIRYMLTRHQRRAEHEKREARWGHKERDTLESYLSIRKRVVAEAAPDLSEAEVERLAQMTRGLMIEEIETQVGEYLATGRLSYEPGHPTNTCDPYTGNWAERFLNIPSLIALLEREGLNARVLNGYYGDSNNPLRNLAATILNALITAAGKRGLFFAIYYVIYATREEG